MSPAPAPGQRETAPAILNTWGPLAPAIAPMLVARPGLASKLCLAPCRAFHAVAAYVAAAVEAERPLAEVAAEVDTAHARELLAHAVPEPHHRLYKLLDRLGPTVGDCGLYARLNAALHGPGADVLLDADTITAKLVQVAEEIARDPVLVAARRAISDAQPNLRALRSVLAYLRAAGLAREIEELPSGSGFAAVNRRVRADLGRAQALVPPWTAPPGWRLIEDVSSLFRTARALENCLSCPSDEGGMHLQLLLSHEVAYLVADDGPAAMASIRRVGPALWAVGTISGRSRGWPWQRGGRHEFAEACDAFRAALAGECQRVGHEPLDMGPAAAAGLIADRAAGEAPEADGDEGGTDA